jgi:hypothetical protein
MAHAPGRGPGISRRTATTSCTTLQDPPKRSDTSNEPGTPLYYARLDGSAAVHIFGDRPMSGFNRAQVWPSGALAVAPFQAGVAVQPVAGGATINGPSGYVGGIWRSDSRALVMVKPGDAGTNWQAQPHLFTLATATTQALPASSSAYLWATWINRAAGRVCHASMLLGE